MYQNIVLENDNWISDSHSINLCLKSLSDQNRRCFGLLFISNLGACNLLFLSKGRSVSLTSQLFQRKCVLLNLENIYKLYYEFYQQDAWTNLFDQVRRWFGVLYTSNLEVCDLVFPSNWRSISSTSQLLYWKCAQCFLRISTNCKMNFINRELELITIWPSQKILQFFNNLRFRGGDLLLAYLLLTLNSKEYNLLLTSNKGRLIFFYCPLLWEGHKLLLTDYITVLVRMTYCCKWRTDLKKIYI